MGTASLERLQLDLQRQFDELKRRLSDYTESGSALASRVNGSFLGLAFVQGLLRAVPLPVSLALVNGANENVGLSGDALVYEIAGPTAAFSVGGFTAGVPGRLLFLFNNVAQQMTITNNSGGSTAANRLSTLTGANVVLRAGTSFAIFMYSLANQRWILCASN